jgi:ribosomal protein S2
MKLKNYALSKNLLKEFLKLEIYYGLKKPNYDYKDLKKFENLKKFIYKDINGYRKKINFFKLKRFLRVKSLYSFMNKRLNKKNELNYYLLGLRNKTSIINLNYTCKNLKQFSSFILYFLKSNKKIVFIGFPSCDIEELNSFKHLYQNNYIFLDYHWNYQYLRKNQKNIGLIIVFNEYFLRKELEKYVNKLNIPFLGFSFNDISNFDYIIPGNFSSMKIAPFFYSFLQFLYIKNKISNK